MILKWHEWGTIGYFFLKNVDPRPTRSLDQFITDYNSSFKYFQNIRQTFLCHNKVEYFYNILSQEPNLRSKWKILKNLSITSTKTCIFGWTGHVSYFAYSFPFAFLWDFTLSPYRTFSTWQLSLLNVSPHDLYKLISSSPELMTTVQN